MYIVIPNYTSPQGVGPISAYAWVSRVKMDGLALTGELEVHIHPSAAAGDANKDPLEIRTYRLGEGGMPAYLDFVAMLGPSWVGVKQTLAGILMGLPGFAGSTISP